MLVLSCHRSIDFCCWEAGLLDSCSQKSGFFLARQGKPRLSTHTQGARVTGVSGTHARRWRGCLPGRWARAGPPRGSPPAGSPAAPRSAPTLCLWLVLELRRSCAEAVNVRCAKSKSPQVLDSLSSDENTVYPWVCSCSPAPIFLSQADTTQPSASGGSVAPLRLQLS